MTRQKDESAVSTKDPCSRIEVLAHRALRRRYLMLCVTVVASMVLQILWPHAPFAVFGSLVGMCFFRMLVIQEKQAEKEQKEETKSKSKKKGFFSKILSAVITSVTAALGTYVANTVTGSKRKSKDSLGKKITKSTVSTATRTATRELGRSILGNLIK